MQSVRVQISNAVLVTVICLVIAVWFVYLLKNGLISLSAALKRDSGFDPITMYVGTTAIPIASECCTHRNTSANGTSTSLSNIPVRGTLNQALTQSISAHQHSDTDESIQDLQQLTLARIRLYQWRLGLIRITVGLFCWFVLIDMTRIKGPVVYVYFTIWNFVGIGIYMLMVGLLSLSEFFANWSHSNQVLVTYETCACEMAVVSCSSSVWKYLPSLLIVQPSENNNNKSISRPTQCGSCLRKTSWLFLSMELANSILVTLVVWLVLVPFANNRNRRILLLWWNIIMHIANLIFIWVDYLMIPVSVVSDVSVSTAEENTHVCCEFICTIQAWSLITLAIIYLFSTWMNHSLGSRYPYFFVDPSQSFNAVWMICLLLFNLLCWLFVWWFDTRCFKKRINQIQSMEQFFDVIQSSLIEGNQDPPTNLTLEQDTKEVDL